MKIIGFDPGTDRIGVGILEKNTNTITYTTSFLLPIKKSSVFGETLFQIEREIKKILKKHQPSVGGIETLFFSKNKTTALSVAAARGIILKTLAENKIPYLEIAPTTVKKFITGSGRAEKRTVAKMVGILLKIETKKMIDDESDALAIALSTSFLTR